MILIRELKVDANKTPDPEKAFFLAVKKAMKLLGMKKEEGSFEIVRRSLDARKKPALFWVFTLSLQTDREEELLFRHTRSFTAKAREAASVKAGHPEFSAGRRGAGTPCVERDLRPVYQYPAPKENAVLLKTRPVVAGFGPAGLFCAYLLANAGFSPIVIEQGGPVEERKKAVERFWQGGKPDPHTNVQCGEGGAGTFSDGKLSTGNQDKEGRHREILRLFYAHGAPEDILYDAKPHLGTDVLFSVMKSFREDLLSMGAEIRFHTALKGLEKRADGYLLTLSAPEGESALFTEKLFCGIGHSARETFSMLKSFGLFLEKKAFAIGLRIVHPQRLIDAAQYGAELQQAPEEEPLLGRLPAASYKLTGKGVNGRPVFSFCMCPGGYVVDASSEEGGIVVNGMSDHARDGEYANAAIVLGITPEEMPGEDPILGMEWQRELERKAYALGHGHIPCCSLEEFRRMRLSAQGIYPFAGMGKGTAQKAPLWELFSADAYRDFLYAMEGFGRKIKRFDSPEAMLFGIESRTSCPVRIRREPETMEALGFPGLYPIGEGAGYAGGIMSSAADGMKAAERFIGEYLPGHRSG